MCFLKSEIIRDKMGEKKVNDSFFFPFLNHILNLFKNLSFSFLSILSLINSSFKKKIHLTIHVILYDIRFLFF